MTQRLVSTALCLALCGADAFAAGSGVVLTRDAAIGARYTAPGPRSCASTTQPVKGPITPVEARAYVICARESVGVESLMLQSKVQVQVAKGRPYIHGSDNRLEAIDTGQLVYDIRGSSVMYTCSAPSNLPGYASRPRSQLCSRTATPNNTGKCYRTTFGDWKCTWGDFTAPMFGTPVAPPSESEAE